MDENEPRVFLTVEQAIEMLPDREEIHTLHPCNFGLVGGDWGKQDVIDQIKKYKPELSGKLATSMGHKLCLGDYPDYGLFIETK